MSLLAACASGRTARQPQVRVAPPRVITAQAADSVPAQPQSDTTTPAAASHPAGPDSDTPGLTGPLTVRVRITDEGGTRIVTLPMDEYVVGAVRAELLPRALQGDAAERMLEVQAIVSRTYAMANMKRHGREGFDLCDSTHCQLYRGRLSHESRSDLASRAVAATRGEVVTYGGRVIQALFHSNCGGHTTAASSVWGGRDQPYLQAVPDSFCARSTPGDWNFAIDEATLRRALNSDPRTETGARLDRIDIVEHDPSGRAEVLAIAGVRTPVVRAEEFRTVMRRVFGPRSIRSTWFRVSRTGTQFEFSGVGFGHGVGLCQTGAALRARAGQSPMEIISHYFPGTRLLSASAALATPTPASIVDEE